MKIHLGVNTNMTQYIRRTRDHVRRFLWQIIWIKFCSISKILHEAFLGALREMHFLTREFIIWKKPGSKTHILLSYHLSFIVLIYLYSCIHSHIRETMQYFSSLKRQTIWRYKRGLKRIREKGVKTSEWSIYFLYMYQLSKTTITVMHCKHHQ